MRTLIVAALWVDGTPDEATAYISRMVASMKSEKTEGAVVGWSADDPVRGLGQPCLRATLRSLQLEDVLK